MSNGNSHEKVEKNVGLMAVLIAVAVSFGGLAEIVPLMFQAEAIKPLEGVKPYPDAWHASLLQGAEQLLSSGVVDWDEYRALKALANGGHARALEEALDNRLADPEA